VTPDQLRDSPWRRLYRDVYVHRDVPVTHELRVLAVASLLVPEAVVTGCSAAVLWGVDLAGPEDDVELTLPPTAHPRRVAGVRVRRAVLPPGEVLRRRGVLATTPEATAVRVAAALPHDEAVVAVDRLVAARTVDLAPIRTLAAAQSGPGAGRARRVCALADGRAESPQETRLRLLMLRGGLPLPVAQYVVRCDGVFVARVDFAWPDLKVAVEYDGLWHAAEGQFARDRQRLNRLHAAGWRVVFVTAADLHHPEQLIARIAAALAP
jgi:very-short-patch-repair endonuclease